MSEPPLERGGGKPFKKFFLMFFSLCLEWNCVGLMDNAFAVLCEGLGSNSCLQILDLRNNQISHQGAAELAAALKRNPHLKALGNS